MTIARGALVGGKYRLEERLAVGGMGSVWRARHVLLGVPVAVKFMDPAHVASPIALRRFELEAKSAASIDSPNIVHVSDYGVDGPVPYIVMELLEGEDLGRRLARKQRLSMRAVATIVSQAARGLQRTHDAGIVHRDLKPSNIYLARSGGEEVVKILDFGIAKDTASESLGEATKPGELMGSPHYMSPEQIRGERDLDGRSDAWSLAVIAFRAVTGQLPFGGEVLGAVLGKVLADPVVKASEVAPELPPEIDAFFERCFERDRDRRFASVEALADAFVEIASLTSVSMRSDAPPSSVVELEVDSTDIVSLRPPPLPAAKTSRDEPDDDPFAMEPPSGEVPLLFTAPPLALTPVAQDNPLLLAPPDASAPASPKRALTIWIAGIGAAALVAIAFAWSNAGGSSSDVSTPAAIVSSSAPAAASAPELAPVPSATAPAASAPAVVASSAAPSPTSSAKASADKTSTPKKSVPSTAAPPPKATAVSKPSWGF